MTSEKPEPIGGDERMPSVRDALIGLAIGVLIIYGGSHFDSSVLWWLSVGIGVVWVLVMVAYVVEVWVTRYGPKLTPRVKRLRGHTLTDPVLGVMQRDVRARAWIATPIAGNGTIEFQIDGDEKPDGPLLERAREVAATFAAVRDQVADFLTEQARIEAAEDAGVASEIQRLQIRRLVFLSMNHPRTFLIHFEVTGDERFWQCEYTDGRPDALDYD
jgi:hypothetical protein